MVYMAKKEWKTVGSLGHCTKYISFIVIAIPLWMATRKLRHQQQLKSILLPHGTSLKHGFLKFNVDAASFEDQQHFGIGIYIRDNQAQFVKAKTIFLPGLPEPSERSWSPRSFSCYIVGSRYESPSSNLWIWLQIPCWWHLFFPKGLVWIPSNPC